MISRKKCMAFAALALSVSMLSGCIPGGGIESLLYPPELSEEQEEIFSALTDSVGDNISLQYPKGGSNRSPVVIWDIDGDGTD
ncbi:MAG: hypothetical protein ACI4JF_05840, partial [Oscillospiraceae bacterium]